MNFVVGLFFFQKRISFHQIRKPSLLQHTKYVERKPRYFLKPSCKIQWATIDLSLKRLRRWIYIHPNLQRRTTNKGGETARSSYNLLIEKLEYNFKASEKKFVITMQNPYVQQYYHICLLSKSEKCPCFVFVQMNRVLCDPVHVVQHFLGSMIVFTFQRHDLKS